MSVQQVVLTYEDLLECPDDGKRYELFEGELSMTRAPSPQHQTVSGNLNFILFQHVREHQLGELYFAPLDCIFNNTTVVEPDLVFVGRDRVDRISTRGVEGVPTLAVEINSPTTSRIDRVRKYQLYAKFGVPYYWILDPAARVFEAYELQGEKYIMAQRTSDETISVRPFPDLALPVSSLWA